MELGLKPFTGRISDNDIRLMRTFSTVVKHGGFVAAESELQIGLPSISRYIKDLEIRLGVRLCDRGRRGFTLTAEGKQVHDACQKLFDDLGMFESRVRDIYTNPAGAINLGMVDALITDPNFRMTRVFDSYKAAYPNVHFRISSKTSNFIEQEVIDGELDIGIVFERRRMEQLNYHLLYEEVCFMYCTEDHPVWHKCHGDITEDDLTQCDFVGYPFEHEMEKLGVRGLLKRTATVDNMEALSMLVASGRYLGFLPDHYVACLPNPSRFRKVLSDTFGYKSHISIITRQGKLSPLINAFVDHVEAINSAPSFANYSLKRAI